MSKLGGTTVILTFLPISTLLMLLSPTTLQRSISSPFAFAPTRSWLNSASMAILLIEKGCFNWYWTLISALFFVLEDVYPFSSRISLNKLFFQISSKPAEHNSRSLRGLPLQRKMSILNSETLDDGLSCSVVSMVGFSGVIFGFDFTGLGFFGLGSFFGGLSVLVFFLGEFSNFDADAFRLSLPITAVQHRMSTSHF
jgi:hypothetical protein